MPKMSCELGPVLEELLQPAVGCNYCEVILVHPFAIEFALRILRI